jgi:hypothetical protein
MPSKLVVVVGELLKCWDNTEDRDALKIHIENLRKIVEGKNSSLTGFRKIEKASKPLLGVLDPDKNTINQLHDPELWAQAAVRWAEKLKDSSLNHIWIKGLADICSTVAVKLKENSTFDVVDFVVMEQFSLHERAFGN